MRGSKTIAAKPHRVAIQRATESQGATGEITKTWATLATVWAAIEPLTGREFFQAQQVQAEVSHKITMRHYTGITISPKDRLLYGTRVFRIESMLNVEERSIELVLMCREEVS